MTLTRTSSQPVVDATSTVNVLGDEIGIENNLNPEQNNSQVITPPSNIFFFP